MTTHTQQSTEFTTRTDADGRSITSSLIIDGSTDARGRHLELELMTTHRPGRGYSATIARVLADEVTRSVAITFGEDSDVRSLDLGTHAPLSTRFSRISLASLHAALLSDLGTVLPERIEWAKQNKRLD
ncbi:MAG: hypothetical protein ACK5LO_10085 [Leucobacter sp.]